jgi:hypothetical protein
MFAFVCVFLIYLILEESNVWNHIICENKLPLSPETNTALLFNGFKQQRGHGRSYHSHLVPTSKNEWKCIFTHQCILMTCTRKTTFLNRPNRPGRIRLEIQEAPVSNANQLRLENLKRRGYLETLRLFMRILLELFFLMWQDMD